MMGEQRDECRDCTRAEGRRVYVAVAEFDEHQSAAHGYPSPGELEFWWSCWRKVAHADEPTALAAVAEAEDPAVVTYLCRWGRPHWHVGHPRATTTTKVKPSDLRRQWRKRTSVPPVEVLRAAMRETIDTRA